MSENNLLVPAIFIFSVMVIGLIYTVVEFTKARLAQEKKDEEND